jgi:hypothetical protein
MSMKKRTLTLAFVLFVLFVRSACAQDALHTMLGISFGMANNVHSADFSALPGVPDAAGHFAGGLGNGFAISALYQYPISGVFFLDSRLGYIDHSATLLAAPVNTTTLVTQGKAVTGGYTHTIDLVASSYGLELRLGAHVIKGLVMTAGLRAGILSAKYIQKETASIGGFADSSGKDSLNTIRNQHYGSLPNASSLVLHGILGIAYEFPINNKRSAFIVPEITYTPALSNIISGLSWKTNAVIYGIVVKFTLD